MFNIQRIKTIFDYVAEENLPASPFCYETKTAIVRQELETGITAEELLKDQVNTAILGAVNKLLCATEYQVADALTQMGLTSRYAQTRKRMYMLAACGLLDAYEYRCEGQANSRAFFCLGEQSRQLICSLGGQPEENPYLPLKEPVRVMKLLSVNQFVTKTNIPIDQVRMGRKVSSANGRNAFRPQAAMILNGMELFVEGVRREADWADALCCKLERGKRVLAGREVPPCMILVGEDAGHCGELIELFGRERYPFTLWYTADDLVYRDPKKCLYELEGGFRNRLREEWQLLFG